MAIATAGSRDPGRPRPSPCPSPAVRERGPWRALRLLAAVFLVAAAQTKSAVAQTVPGSPFTANGWQLHDYNMPKLEEAIRRARGYGVNFLIFSHELFRSVEGFLASTDDVDPAHPPAAVAELRRGEHFRLIPGWQSDLRRLGDLAAAEKIPYYLWVHEFDDLPRRFLPGGRVNMEDPQLWVYLRARYQRLLDIMPGTAGFVLTLHESDLKVFRHGDVISRDDVAGRVRKVSQMLYDLLKARGKQLIVRNFFYEPL